MGKTMPRGAHGSGTTSVITLKEREGWDGSNEGFVGWLPKSLARLAVTVVAALQQFDNLILLHGFLCLCFKIKG